MLIPSPYATTDLDRVFDSRTLTRGRTLVLFDAVSTRMEDGHILGEVEERGTKHQVEAMPRQQGHHVVFDRKCSCGLSGCTHLAATLLAALERFPPLRRPAQVSMLDRLAQTAPGTAPARLVFTLQPASPPDCCTIVASHITADGGRITPAPFTELNDDASLSGPVRALARELEEGTQHQVTLAADRINAVLPLLVASGHGVWRASGKRIVAAPDRVLDPAAPSLPPKSSILLSDDGAWFVDGSTGGVGHARLRTLIAPLPPAARAKAKRVVQPPPEMADKLIVEHPVVPLLRLGQLECPDDFGVLRTLDALTIDFDYGGVAISSDDPQQFVRLDGPTGPSFIRRDLAAEEAAFQALSQDGFNQMRLADTAAAKGRRVLVFRGAEAPSSWHRFMAARVPTLEAQGWRVQLRSQPGRNSRPAGSEGHRHGAWRVLAILQHRYRRRAAPAAANSDEADGTRRHGCRPGGRR